MSSPDPELAVDSPGMQITFDKGKRAIRVWRDSNGGFVWEFEKDGVLTPLWLSPEAMNVVLELHHRITWRQLTDDSGEPAP